MTKVNPSSSISSVTITNPVHTDALALASGSVKTVPGPWRTLHLPGTTTTWEVSLSRRTTLAPDRPHSTWTTKTRYQARSSCGNEKLPEAGNRSRLSPITAHATAYVSDPWMRTLICSFLGRWQPRQAPLPCFTSPTGKALVYGNCPRPWKGPPPLLCVCIDVRQSVFLGEDADGKQPLMIGCLNIHRG